MNAIRMGGNVTSSTRKQKKKKIIHTN